MFKVGGIIEFVTDAEIGESKENNNAHRFYAVPIGTKGLVKTERNKGLVNNACNGGYSKDEKKLADSQAGEITMRKGIHTPSIAVE